MGNRIRSLSFSRRKYQQVRSNETNKNRRRAEFKEATRPPQNVSPNNSRYKHPLPGANIYVRAGSSRNKSMPANARPAANRSLILNVPLETKNNNNFENFFVPVQYNNGSLVQVAPPISSQALPMNFVALPGKMPAPLPSRHHTMNNAFKAAGGRHRGPGNHSMSGLSLTELGLL